MNNGAGWFCLQSVQEKQKPDSKTQQASRPAGRSTMKPATAKGAGVRREALRYIYEWLHKPQELKPQGILFYYTFITPLLRLYYARLVIAHFWLWVLLILGQFSGSGKSHETFMPAKWPCHYPRDIRKTSAGGRKWVDEVSNCFW